MSNYEMVSKRKIHSKTNLRYFNNYLCFFCPKGKIVKSQFGLTLSVNIHQPRLLYSTSPLDCKKFTDKVRHEHGHVYNKVN